MEKIKVVWICHFSNKLVRHRLPLSKLILKSHIKKLFGKKPPKYIDFAPWVSTLIKEFEQFENTELHVIAPHIGLKKSICEFEMNGVYYHFFKSDKPLIHLNILEEHFRNSKNDYKLNRDLVDQFINSIKPDIVNLIGAENPYYSITALDIQKIPVYVLLQTVLSTPFKEIFNFKVDKNRIEIERKIFESKNYFGTGSRMYRDCVLNVNPSANVFDFWFPTQLPPYIPAQPFEFDFVFFASGLSPVKGIEEAIEAFGLVVKNKMDVKMNIIGSCDKGYKEVLQNKIKELGIEQNVEFSDYFSEHKDMFVQVKKSKIAILPNRLDVISSTIREAMFLEIPVVTTITTGTPYLNKDYQTVLLSKIGDIQALTDNMIELLYNNELRNDLVANAKNLADRIFDNTAIAKKLVNDNIAILNHYNNKIKIPQELLFNIENYPEY